MNKIYKVAFSLILVLMTFLSFGQAKKLMMFEHFTQASCAPCAAQNPAFQAIYSVNTQNANHVAYHTSWPGVDEMNAANPSEVAAMVTLYTVTGVPDMVVNGKSIGSPTATSQNLIDQAGISPIRIQVEDTKDTSGVHHVKVTVHTLVDVPAGDYILRTLIAEELVTYATPPGSNGEKEFPNVFRKFISTNGSAGDVIIPASAGSSVEFNYTYTVLPKWNEAEIYPIAYVQEKNTKEIIQSGTSRDEKFEAINIEPNSFQKGDQAIGNKFNFNLNNLGEEPIVITISLGGSWPADWNAAVEIDGITYKDGDQITIDAHTEVSGSLHATVGSIAGIGEFLVGIYDEVNDIKQTFSYTIISGVTDLLIVTDNKPATGNPDLKVNYLNGLVNAGETALGTLGGLKALKGFEDNVLDEVQHIYYSVGWTFPAMDNDFAGYIMNFMDNGGNFMVAGQDVLWDMASGDVNANGTAGTKTLVTDYLKANYVADGDASNSTFQPVKTDFLFGALPSSAILQSYTAANYYPDQMTAIAPEGKAIFTYNTASKIAGVRSEHANFKTVNLGIGLEMIAEPGMAESIMQITHDWFHGILTNTEFDNYIQNLGMSQNYPNPANNFTTITLGSGVENELTLRVVDVTGKLVLTQQIASGSKSETINTSNLTNGIYQYFLTDGKTFNAARKLVVMH